jgi:adenylate kinase
MLAELPKDKTLVLNFKVSDEELIKRISGRYTCKNCNAGYHKDYKKPKVEGVCDNCGSTEFVHREDDRVEAVKVRVEVYNQKTAPLIQYYRDSGELNEISGMDSISKISSKIDSIIANV